jgi:hypothetical protein
MMRRASGHGVCAEARALAFACMLAGSLAPGAMAAHAAETGAVPGKASSAPAASASAAALPPGFRDPGLPPGFRDPGLPPALRADAPAEARARALAAMRAAPRTSGAALAAQVQRNLRESFDAADVTRRGALTREQARAGGFGFVDRHFEEIDRRHAGEITFADLQDFLARRAAAASAPHP